MTGEVVVGCDELQPTLDFFVALGFELVLISPADSPRVGVVVGHGLRLRIDAGRANPGLAVLRLPASAVASSAFGEATSPARESGGPPELIGPNGTVVQLVADDAEAAAPAAHQRTGFELSTVEGHGFGEGRASMRYRDLLPSRQGGRVIASLIEIPDGGPVPDYVHHHAIRFQLIFCRRGWVRVVYEDQGEPFVMEAGDCVLQPPGIRHRVLEASAGLEVVEIGSPAEHDTHVDRELELPTDHVRPDRLFGDQRFWRHVARSAGWASSDDGVDVRDLGLTDPTGGLVTAKVVRRSTALASGRTEDPNPTLQPDGDEELYFVFVDRGRAVLATEDGTDVPLGSDDAVALAPMIGDRITAWSDDFEALVVTTKAEG